MPCSIGRVLLPLLVLSRCSALLFRGTVDASGADGEPCVFKEWGSTPYLEGVQVLPTRTDHLPFVGFEHGSMEREGLFVYPRADLAMCIIEKNGCSAWTTIWNKLTRNMLEIASPWYGVVPHHWSEESAASVFNRTSTHRILWVRDPLERFLSGFLDKCVVRDTEHSRHICSFNWFKNGTSTHADQSRFPLSRVRAWFEDGNGIMDANTHFTTQASHCELTRRLKEYNIIGLMTKASFSRDASCILERVHQSVWNEQGGTDGKPFFTKPANPTMDARRNAEVLKKFYTREFAEFMMDIFREDYELFRLRKPEWVKHATGEWFHEQHEVVSGEQEPKSRDLEALEAEEDEDDLLTLASRAGFNLPE
eukprot:CAMPEP_0171255240 /NCGR_PEP_ID=MMETSP0790-20130122/52663_1 /TAXON_ID=2925 /ORGANISM="Alexandrium catenella, Strain OF101" /LENGTH=364 /DNA_ID=CAMNT_0011723183 /DNA_START=11 /DNA_END=1105 /DNA_ORIENTATION=+